MPHSKSARWFAGCDLNRPAALRLFCLPYAGGAAQIFRLWRRSLPVAVEVCPIQLPGRGGRLAEPAPSRLFDTVDVLAPVIAPLTDRPYALFGHSMGATLAYELTRRLLADGRPGPRCLMVSGASAPHLPRQRAPLHGLPEAEFKAALADLGGTPQEVLDSGELMALLMPLLRADFAAVETYRAPARPPLACRVVAFAGQDDRDVPVANAAAWRDHTTGPFRLEVLPGGHFFLHDQADHLLPLVAAELQAALSPPVSGPVG